MCTWECDAQACIHKVDSLYASKPATLDLYYVKSAGAAAHAERPASGHITGEGTVMLYTHLTTVCTVTGRRKHMALRAPDPQV